MTAETAQPPPSLHICAAVFLPAPLPREGRIAFWHPDGDALPRDATDEITVVREAPPAGRPGDGTPGGDIRSRTVPAVLLPVAEAVPLLVRARRHPAAHPAAACWGAAALHALHLVARGRLLPGLTATDHDAWRAGPLDAEDIAQLRAIAAAMPHEAYGTPVSGPGTVRLPEPEALVRAFFDAVADTLPRTPAAAYAVGAPFAAAAPQRLPGAREWAAEAAAGMDAGVRVSLRLDLSAFRLFDIADARDTAATEDTAGGADFADAADVTDATDATEGAV
ncbi:ATP-dependent helicase, partial [Streptomyces sp. NPDC055078]